MDEKPNGDGPRGSGTSLSPGSLLAHTYEIVGLMARGGMGEVYRARHRYMGTEHAIKIILPELASDQRVVGLFQREAQVLRQLRHEAVVGYDGLFSDEHGRVYLAMEFVDGPSLKAALTKGALKPDEVRMLRDRLAAGLAAAHEAGVVHRDLSPDNVILPGGRLDQAKIIDFGIAKRTDPEKSTIIGSQFAGKYSYASPEQFGMYGGDVGPKSDIYSLGLILAAAASGRPLPMGTSTIEVVEARRQVPDLKGVPGELRGEIAPMLEPDPKNRPPSMRQVIGAGRRSREPQPGARPGVAPAKRRAGRPAKRRAGKGLAIALGLLLLLAGAGAGGFWYWQQTQADGRRAILADIDGALAGLDCARLTGELEDDGTVVVSGRIGSEEARDALIGRLGGIEGVTGVRNYLAVRPCGGPEIDRDAIRLAMDRAFAELACADLSATVSGDGTVRLAGRIGSEADLQALRDRIAGFDGVSSVEDTVRIEPCPEDGDMPALRAAVDEAVQGYECSDVTAAIGEDGRVRLFGRVASREDFDALQDAVAAVAGVTAVDNAVAIRPCEVPGEPAGPDRDAVAEAVGRAVSTVSCGEVSARVDEDRRVRLEGWIGSEGQARALRTAVGAIDGVRGVTADLDYRPCLPEDFRPAELAAEIAELAAGPACSEVSAELTDDLRVVLSGYVGSDRDRRRLETQLAGLDHVGGVEGELAVYQWPLCEVMGLGGGGASAIGITANNPDGVYQEGETLVVEVTAPGFDGFLYVDYFDSQGNVVHMLPSPARPENTVSAGETVTIGGGDGRTYMIRPPLGTSMILAVASPSRLFAGDRAEVEDARSYLTDLRRALIRLQGGAGRGVEVQFLVLTLLPA